MSMFTPPGVGGRRPVRRSRRGWHVGVLLLALVLAAALAGAGWWLTQREDDEPPAAAARPTCPEPSPAPTLVAPRAITVNVYNATKRRGLAGTVATELRKRGFRVGKVDNDPLERKVTAAAEIRNSTQGVDAARTVIAQVGTVVAAPDQRKEATVDLVLGSGFRALQPPAAAAAALSPTPQPVPAGC